MGGHIHFFFSNPINVAAQIKSGRLRAIAVTGQSRVKAFPDAPTFAEEGLPAMRLTNWQGVGGPAGIPKPIIDRLSAEIRKLVARPDTREKLNAQGSEPYYNDPEQTAALIRSDIAKYGKIIKDANIKVE
jgi:tripartite-type tricarboxylate transporter receptor subunit TctC